MKFLNDKGNIAVMAALTMPMVIGGAGLGVETGYWYYQQLRLQQAADAAAYAAALEQRGGSDDEATQAGASAAAATNGFDPAEDTIEIVTPSTMETDETNSVDVILARTVPRAFTALFGSDPIHITARATAAYSTAANACVLALDKSATPSIMFTGSSTASMTGCVVMSNSLAPTAVASEGNASVTAPCIMAVGGASMQANGPLELTQCEDVLTGQPPAADPFREMEYPTPTGCAAQVGDGASPGCFTGGVTLKNTVSLNPGVYIIKGGSLKINAGALVSGSGVTFVLMDGATVDINGNATVNIAAPTSGDYKGMLFMGSRTSGAGGISKFNGTATSTFTGAIYFPKQQIEYLGNFSGNGGCTQIVGATVKWSGNTHFNVDCSAYGLEPITAGSAVRLIG